VGEDDWLEFAYESANGADVELEDHDQFDDEEND
jgi:hypothetical protein